MLFRKSKRRSRCSTETQQLIFEVYFDRVYRFALSVTRNPAAAEEIAQETFTIAFAKYDQLQDRSKIGAWLNAIALNLARAESNHRKKVVPMDPEDQALVQDDRSSEDFESVLAQRETSLELKKAVNNLPPDSRDVVLLKYYEELEVEEIARLLKLPEGTVKSRLSRSRNKLRRILMGGEGFTKEDSGGKGGTDGVN
ncbi:hypothetical protein SY88_03340 [Clostridiales bacterium PH28_bin88]|nr:hypothetical protein SY88_03340 [Clostridiales bacterium PH28_bin88]